MAKYNYDKKALKGLSVGPFLNEVKVREAEIAKGSEELPNPDFNANVLAAKLHPGVQYAVVSKIVELCGAKTFVLAPDTSRGTGKLAYFRAGQYVSIALEIGGTTLNKPYSLCSDPKDALVSGTYEITVKATKDGFASKYILENWAVGTPVVLSGPLGDFNYVALRDAPDVVAIAGGSGVTPFLSMARAIASGAEDFRLTVLYGSRTHDAILLKDELSAAAAASGGKVKLVNVLSDDDVEGFEKGFITSELVSKYAPAGDYSVFVCGPKAMYEFAEVEMAKLGLPKRRIRFELSGEYGNPEADAGYPKDKAGSEFKLKVLVRGEELDLVCKSSQSLISAIEAAGIRVPSDCRSGICGWCHSRLVSGEVYVPAKADGRREADRKFGWIHPCASYPLSDIVIEVFPLL